MISRLLCWLLTYSCQSSFREDYTHLMENQSQVVTFCDVWKERSTVRMKSGRWCICFFFPFLLQDLVLQGQTFLQFSSKQNYFELKTLSWLMTQPQVWVLLFNKCSLKVKFATFKSQQHKFGNNSIDDTCYQYYEAAHDNRGLTSVLLLFGKLVCVSICSNSGDCCRKASLTIVVFLLGFVLL